MRNTLTVAILFVCIKTGSGRLSQKPQDSAAVIGQSAYFNCSTSEPSKRIQWYHYDVDEAQREAIYRCDNSIEYWYPCYRNGRYVVERNQGTGAYNLVIPTVVSSDAGRFLCEVDGDEGMANLTVRVESNPTCVASEICKPYIKPYSTAIICIFVIILIVGTICVLWYLRVYRPKKLKQKVQMLVYIEQATRIKDLEDELQCKSIEATGFEDQLLKKSDEMKKLQEKTTASDREINRLFPAGNISYADKPTLVHTILTAGAKQQCTPINGIVILGKELFILYENTSVIQVNDSDTFQFLHSWEVKGMSHPMDIAACKIANCIYIIFREDNKPKSQIMKLDLKGKPIKNWSTVGESGRLSTYESNVIVCLFEKSLINEYSGDGSLIQTVRLSPDVGFNHPWHAIKVTSSHFAVCHGDAKDELHRVCIVDVQGKIIKELREWKTKDPHSSGKLNVPICIVEDSERSILVADRGNQIVRLMNCLLKHQRNLLKKEMGLDGYPVRICLDETKGRLLVAVKRDSKDDRILIFNIITSIDSGFNLANSGTIR